MALQYQDNGNLIPGVHIITIEDFEKEFGNNEYRRNLIDHLKIGIKYLQDCECSRIFVDGSFVTLKETPGDFDICWDMQGVNLEKLETQYPILVDFENERENQKKFFLGEFFPAQFPAKPGTLYYDFFQTDKDDNPKGIIQINLNL